MHRNALHHKYLMQYTVQRVYFEGINFRGNAFRKVFADLIFVELGVFAACMHAILNSRLMPNPRKPRTFIPSKYTRYTVIQTYCVAACMGTKRESPTKLIAAEYGTKLKGIAYGKQTQQMGGYGGQRRYVI